MKEQNKCCWEEYVHCGVTEVESCPWRQTELAIESWHPTTNCAGGVCSGVMNYAIFLKRYDTEREAAFNLLQTSFIILLLAWAGLSFAADTQKLVIAPIEKMVSIVKTLADDPLSRAEGEAAEAAGADGSEAGGEGDEEEGVVWNRERCGCAYFVGRAG